MKIYLVLTEEYFGGEKYIRGFTNLSDAENYEKELEILTNSRLEIIIKEIDV